MELRHLETFAAIEKAGSFVGAANNLDYSQSTITIQMQTLERELGVELFDREARRASLTEGGRLFREHAWRVLDAVAHLRKSLSDFTSGSAGLVRIAAVEPVANRLTPILAQFMKARPNAKVVLETGGTNSVCARVAQGEVDVGICSSPSPKSGLHFEPLFIEEQLVLLPAKHELASKARIRARDAIQYRLLLTEEGCKYRETIERGFIECGLAISPSLEIDNLNALKNAVQGGLGIAIMPAGVLTPPPRGTVVRALDDVKIHLTIGLVRRADAGRPSQALQLLIDDLRKEFSGSASSSRRTGAA